MFPTVEQLYAYLDRIIPRELSADWDNDGIMVCTSKDREVRRALYCLDVTKECVKKAAEGGIDVIISHHPLIFHPLKSITDEKYVALIRHNISVLSFHTRLDALDGGVNDRLADIVGLENTEKFAGGFGRIGKLNYVNNINSFFRTLEEKLGCQNVRFRLANEYANVVAVASGAGGEFFLEAKERGADTFISGEISHHEMLEGFECGMNMIEVGHCASEWHIVHFFNEAIKRRFPDVTGQILKQR